MVGTPGFEPGVRETDLPRPFSRAATKRVTARPEGGEETPLGPYSAEANTDTNTDTLPESFGQSRFFDRFESYTAHHLLPT